MTIITTLVTRWTRICNHDDDDYYHHYDYHDHDDDDHHRDHIYDNLKAKELVDLLSNVVQVAVNPSQDVQLVKIFDMYERII